MRAHVIGSLMAMLASALPALAQDQTDPPTTPPATKQPETAPPEARTEESDSTITPFAHVEKRGDGPIDMILIPSLWCDWSIFDEFMTRNADRYTMYAVTFPGFAGSDPPPDPDDPSDYASQPWRTNAVRAILKLIREEGLDKPVIVGHADAGRLAMRLAIEHASLVGKAVSIDGMIAVPLGGPEGGPATYEQRQMIVKGRMAGERVPEEFWEHEVRTNAESLVQNPGRAVLLGDAMASVPWPIAKRYWLESIAEDFTNQIGGLQDGLLIIAALPDQLGEADLINLKGRWRESVRGAEEAKLVFVDDSRQFVMYDKPEKLDEIIGVFLGVIEPPADDAEKPDEPAGSKAKTVGQ